MEQNNKCDTQQKLRLIKKVIKEWNKKVNGNIFSKLDVVEEKLALLEDGTNIEIKIVAAKMKVKEAACLNRKL